jgi:hypothetical protein
LSRKEKLIVAFIKRECNEAREAGDSVKPRALALGTTSEYRRAREAAVSQIISMILNKTGLLNDQSVARVRGLVNNFSAFFLGLAP